MLSPGPVPKSTPLFPLDRAAEVSETSFIHPLHRCPSVSTHTGIAEGLFWKMSRKQLSRMDTKGKITEDEWKIHFTFSSVTEDISKLTKQIDNYRTMLSCSRITDS